MGMDETERHGSGVVIRVESVNAVAGMARDILDPQRAHAVVCVTIPTWGSTPLVDPEAVSAAVADLADVYVLPTGDLSWELTSRLPPRMDVYGGAVRAWLPSAGEEPNPREHPLFFVHSRDETENVIAKLLAAFQRVGLGLADAPELGADVAAVVTGVVSTGAFLTLPGGYRAFAHRSHLTASGLPPERVVRVGQPVRVRVGKVGNGNGAIQVSLLPFEPDPWQRLHSEYRLGMLVEGIVRDLRNFGAFVELLPGARGLLHKSQISTAWVSHPEDYLTSGERITVRIIALDEGDEKADLSLLDISEDTEPTSPISIYPDGPPWLADDLTVLPTAVTWQEQSEAVADERDAADAGTPGRPTEAASLGTRELAIDELVIEAQEVPVEPPMPEAEERDAAFATARAAEDAGPPADELAGLRDAVEDAHEVQAGLDQILSGAEDRLAVLRGEASQVRRRLESDLAEARLRILALAEQGVGELIGSTEAALADAHAQVEELQERLTAIEEDRRALLLRLHEERERTRATQRKNEGLAKALDDREARIRGLEAALNTAGVSEAQRFVDEVSQAWERMTTPADRDRYPWRDPRLGPDFLDSLGRVHGVSRERVVEVCAHVVSGRAPDVPSLELHPLRISEGGGTPQRVRDDGAKAWRCSLQVKAPAARRLHYWELPGGGVELARLVYHDDYSI
jgi:predicted RNA-binding protein with RPS1 domain